MSIIPHIKQRRYAGCCRARVPCSNIDQIATHDEMVTRRWRARFLPGVTFPSRNVVSKGVLSAVSVKYSVYLSPRAAPPVKGVFTDTVEWGQFECGVGVLWRL